MISFDKNGNIIPYELIEINLQNFENIFILEREDKKHRNALFQGYLDYVNKIQKSIGSIAFQFINGSFTSNKLFPNDIDLVTFLDYKLYRSKTAEIEVLSQQWENIPGIDAYIVPFSLPGHPYFMKTQLIYDYWVDLFSHDRPNEHGQNPLKGFIKINFNA